jgi:hypothetical protein
VASQLASDRTSCRSATANQVRLVLHTAAYWLMLTVRDAIPKSRDLANAEFTTLRLRLIKIAGPRHRNRKPRPCRLRGMLSGSRSLSWIARRSRPTRTMTEGATAPSAIPVTPARSKVPFVRR